jgi:xylulokinase
MLTLGVDIGTSSLKLGVIDVDSGRFTGGASGEYKLIHPQAGWSEINPDCYWQAFTSALSKLGQTIDLKNIRALSVSAQGQTFVPIDREGHALQNAWTWIDARASAESNELIRKFASGELFMRTGCESISPGCFPAMVSYLRKNDPETFCRTWKFLITNSYLIWRLTGRTVIDENQAAMLGMYDWHDKKWWPEMLSAVGVDESHLPDVLPSSAVVGELLPTVAESLGLSKNLLVVSGANDQTANAIGTGLLAENNAIIVLGTALVVFNVLEKNAKPIAKGIWSPYPAGGRSYQLGYTNSGCGTLDWAKNLLAADQDYSNVFELAESVPVGSDGVTCLIDIDGKAGFKGDYRGVFAGISRKTDRRAMLRSVLEGIACSVRELSDEMGWNLRGKIVRAVGGGARSDLWMQMHADVLNCTIQRLDHEQSGVMGGAIMAAVGAGLFPSFEVAISRCVRFAKTFSPGYDSAVYEDIYSRFKTLRLSANTFYSRD